MQQRAWQRRKKFSNAATLVAGADGMKKSGNAR
jgi:hypothetical protein